MTYTDNFENSDADELPRLDTIWKRRLQEHGIDDSAVRRNIVNDLLNHEQLLFGPIDVEEFDTIARSQIDRLGFDEYLGEDEADEISDPGDIKDDLKTDLEECLDGHYRGPISAPPKIGAVSDQQNELQPGSGDPGVTAGPPSTLAHSFEEATSSETSERADTNDSGRPHGSEQLAALEAVADEEFDYQNVAEIKNSLRPLVERGDNPVTLADMVRAVSELHRETDSNRS